MARLGMAIDLKLCINCHSCAVACKSVNFTPPGVFWCRVLEKEEGKFPSARRVVLPVLCNHCQEAPCVRVCPTGASYQREDGIVLIDYDKCIGCKACITACPYEARSYIEAIRGYFGDVLTPYEEFGYKKHQEGVVEKCNLCYERLEKGLEPACVEACPTSCRQFGDLDDPNSEVSKLLRARYSFQLQAELGTKPSVSYIS